MVESAGSGEVTVINVGAPENDPIIRKALAMGAHKAIRVNADPRDGMFVARQIANVASGADYKMILTGRESIDYNGGQVAGLLGEMLNMPSVNFITTLEVDGDTAKVSRDIDGGRESLDVSMPCVLSAQKDLCEPRIPNMRGIMQARTKPLDVMEPISVDEGSAFERYELPAEKGSVKLIDAGNPGELIDLLRNEKKLI